MPVARDCLSGAAVKRDAAEMERAKAQMKVSLLTALESSSARAEQIARQHMAYGRVLPRDEILGRIDALTLEQVRRGVVALGGLPCRGCAAPRVAVSCGLGSGRTGVARSPGCAPDKRSWPRDLQWLDGRSRFPCSWSAASALVSAEV